METELIGLCYEHVLCILMANRWRAVARRRAGRCVYCRVPLDESSRSTRWIYEV